MAKFAHIADTHIRNLKYHSEYRAVFKKLFESIKEEKVDFIILSPATSISVASDIAPSTAVKNLYEVLSPQ